MTSQECKRLVAMLVAAFPRAVPDAWLLQTAGVYEAALKDLDFEMAMKCSTRLVSTLRFMPTIAEIRNAVETERDLARRPKALLPSTVSQQERSEWAAGVVKSLAEKRRA